MSYQKTVSKLKQRYDAAIAELNSVANELEQLGQQCAESFANMPDNLKESENAINLERRSEWCEDTSQHIRDEHLTSGLDDADWEGGE